MAQGIKVYLRWVLNSLGYSLCFLPLAFMKKRNMCTTLGNS